MTHLQPGPELLEIRFFLDLDDDSPDVAAACNENIRFYVWPL